EHLRFHAGYLHVRGIGDISGQGAVCDAEGVGVKLTALKTLSNDVDDAVESHGLTVRERRPSDDEVIELESLTFSDPYPEFQRRPVLRSEHETHDTRRGRLRHERTPGTAE